MRGTPFLYTGFTGGLNTIDQPYTLLDTESRDCLNVVGTTRGAILKRNGSTQFLVSPPAVEITSVFRAQFGGTPVLIAVGGTHIYSISTAGVTTDITGAATVTTGTRWEMVQAPVSTGVASEGPVYMVNGTDPPLYWTGTGNVAAWTGVNDSSHYGTSPYVPNGKYMIFHQNRIWMTGVSGDPSAVYFSDIISTGASGGTGDPSSWPLTNVVRFDSSDGYPITGIGEVASYIVVFKEFKSWVITDFNTGANRQLVHGIGCVAHRSIVSTPIGTFFLTSDQGIYLTTGTKVEEMSYRVRPTILNINQSYRQNSAGYFFNNHYYLSFPAASSTSLNRTLDYDTSIKGGAWWLHDLTANEWEVFEPVAGPGLYGAIPGTSNGVRLMFDPTTFQDAGSNYTGANGYSAYWFGAWQRFYEYFMRHRIQIPMIKKRVRQIYFDGSGVIIPVTFKNFNTTGLQQPGVTGNNPMSVLELPIDFAANAQVFGNTDPAQLFGGTSYMGNQMIFGGQAFTQDARIYAPGVAEEWSVGFGNTTSDPFTVNAYAYAVQIRKS